MNLTESHTLEREPLRTTRREYAERLADCGHESLSCVARLLADAPISREWCAGLWTDWIESFNAGDETSKQPTLSEYLSNREDFRAFIEQLSPLGFEDPARLAQTLAGIFDRAIIARCPSPDAEDDRGKQAAAVITERGKRKPAPGIAAAVLAGAEDFGKLKSSDLQRVLESIEAPVRIAGASHGSAACEVTRRQAFWAPMELDEFKYKDGPPFPAPKKWWERLFWHWLLPKRKARWNVEREKVAWRNPQLPNIPANRKFWPLFAQFRNACDDDAQIFAQAFAGVFGPADAVISSFSRIETTAKAEAKLPPRVNVDALRGLAALREKMAATTAKLSKVSATLEL